MQSYLSSTYSKHPIYITDYPIHQKPFYMKINDDNKTVSCMDLLVPEIGELVGGSDRENNYEKLKQRMKELNLINSEEINQKLNWYLDLRQQGR